MLIPWGPLIPTEKAVKDFMGWNMGFQGFESLRLKKSDLGKGPRVWLFRSGDDFGCLGDDFGCLDWGKGFGKSKFR